MRRRRSLAEATPPAAFDIAAQGARIQRAAQAHGRGGQAHGAAVFGAGGAFIKLLGA
ncbi:hypothetical protein [Methylobacterium sp. ARG-1]|uniref:hypothetical protein n=1 Tax=Methylobacterium sp. ARG-1 TaxID=1692501 RepID=UPI000A5EE8F8|nr:hypothetical protein [Methylobacterium sp. ARG-1]